MPIHNILHDALINRAEKAKKNALICNKLRLIQAPFGPLRPLLLIPGLFLGGEFFFWRLPAPVNGIVSRVPIRPPIVPGTVAFSVLHRVHKTILLA
jgi:hypothetical protein